MHLPNILNSLVNLSEVLRSRLEVHSWYERAKLVLDASDLCLLLLAAVNDGSAARGRITLLGGDAGSEKEIRYLHPVFINQKCAKCVHTQFP